MTAYVLAVDNGSQSTKVSVVDGRGQVHATGRQALRPYVFPAPGQVVHPDDDVWDSVVGAIRAALAAFTGDVSDIVGVGLCTIRFCRAGLTADGRLAGPMMSWMDDRVGRPHLADPVVRSVVSSSGYVALRLTGQRRDAAANLQGVWPIDQDTWRWAADSGPYLATGMSRDLLFELVDPGGELGRITSSAAAETGLPVGLPVIATANDKAVEALGCGVVDDSTALISLGTYIAAMTGSGTRRSDSDGRFWANFASVPQRYLLESEGIRRGMWTVSWLRELLGADLDDLTALAQAVAPGSGGLVTILDWLAPAEHPHRRGAFLGFDGTQGREHLFRSVLEAIAFTMRRHTSAMESAVGTRFDSVVVSGGGAGSDLVMQLFADVFDRPAIKPAMADAAGLGAAVCAAVGTGLHPDWTTAIAEMVHPGQVFRPQPAAVETYADLSARYDRITRHTDPLFAELAADHSN